VFRYTAPALSTNGVTGRPSEATAELGAVLFERTVTALAELVERARTEEPPLGVAPPPDLSPTPMGPAPFQNTPRPADIQEGVPSWTP
jgi:hypothetical protein